jgi:hypothetical protein
MCPHSAGRVENLFTISSVRLKPHLQFWASKRARRTVPLAHLAHLAHFI